MLINRVTKPYRMKPKYNIFVRATKEKEFKEEYYICPNCNQEIQPRDWYQNKCPVCGQLLEWDR